jgi:hypothetical protein
MSCTISLAADERKTLLHLYRHSTRPELAHRAHILLLLDQGLPWAAITAVLFTSPSTIARWQTRFCQDGIVSLVGQMPGRRPLFSWHWARVVAR